MKVPFKIAILLFSLPLLNSYSFAQGEKIDIMLTVNVDEINSSNMNQTCSFGQPESISNEDFTTVVQLGDEIKWKIQVLDSSKGAAKLVKYKHETGPNFFKKDSIEAKNNRIKGEIKADAGNDGDMDKYTLEFRVKKQGTNEWTTYAIDPKLKLSIQD